MASVGGDAIKETVVDWRVQVVFPLPGDGIIESVRVRADKIRFMPVLGRALYVAQVLQRMLVELSWVHTSTTELNLNEF